MVRALRAAGCRVTVLDDLSTGHRDLVGDADLVQGSIGDAALLDALLERGSFDAVLHFAARSLVGESMADPAGYWMSNAVATLTLLAAMRRHGVQDFLFSSTAAVYGEPARMPVTEADACKPTSPYGRSKLAVEHIIEDFSRAYGLRAAVLRYFNAAGAHPDGDLGERHSPETHLIPLVMHCALDMRGAVSVFGCDYPTPDGTCVRDYVHVCDLVDAHLLALERLLDGRWPGGVFNLGNSRGHSVREVIECARTVTRRPIATCVAPRRPGDPPVLIAASSRARAELGWRPKYESLDAIVATAWRWHASRAVT